ncbi:hypothetical protein DL762_002769 [Monosporascus cannonballus]|uniref:Molybdate-anion transporter n=1 Tax=Monosporascus cannonballus TaxID=155416 RepID=A0ABY0HCF2_9PEZI|nr:hypothetical protein DL763_010788 [Monosporascus cannonballus]RYO90247.1 hypothetical protein DL762_002769 [Monosporascus cannonballus]
MGLSIYWIGLLVLAPTVAFAAGHKATLRSFRRWRGLDEETCCERDGEARKLRMTFFRVYLLVMGSEWLQGLYMYTLLRDEKGLPEPTVALIYTMSYASAAATAFATGWLADHFGRHAACLAFCCVHALASASVLVDAIAVLFAGRAAAGVGIALLWTAFESWMVAEYNARGLGPEAGGGGGSGFRLSAVFGIMTTANCIMTITAGFLAYCVVLALGSNTGPFLVGMVLDVYAAILMLDTWNENLGTGGKNGRAAMETSREPGDPSLQQKARDPGTARGSLTDVRVWTLSFVSCCFEGTVFVLMFFWRGTLQEAHAREHPDKDADAAAAAVPYGIAFACFTATMVLGALLFHALARHHGDAEVYSCSHTVSGGGDNIDSNSSHINSEHSWKRDVATVLTPTRLLAVALFLAGARFPGRRACNGVYVPSMASLRSAVVSDNGRASVYGIMNVPLFAFVIVALCTTNGRGGEHRQTVFLLCVALLLVAAVVLVVGVGDIGQSRVFSQL